MFIESCRFCGEVFTSGLARSTHPSNCLSITQDDNEIELPKVEEHFQITQNVNGVELPKVEEHFQNEKRTEKINHMCPFCGQKIGQKHISNVNYHFKKCETFERYIDKEHKTCRLCEVPLKGFVPHFRKFHRDILIENSSEKKQQISRKSKNTDGLNYTCNFCAKSFDSNSLKRRHINKRGCKVLSQHVDLKLRKCNHCGDILKCQFMWHFKVKHPDIKFAEELVIKRNKEIASKQIKPKMCDFCGAYFTSIEYPMNHYRYCSKFLSYIDMKNRKCCKCDHMFGRSESYVGHIRLLHPEALIGKKKSTKTTKVAKLNLVRLPEKLIKNYCSNLDEVNEDSVIENEENQNLEDNKNTDEDEEEEVKDSSLNFQITETTSIEDIDAMDTELSNECISDTDESSNTEEITTVIDNQLNSTENCEVPDLDLQIIDVLEKPIEVIEIEDNPDNQTKLFKCPLCTQKFSTEKRIMKHLLTYHRFSEQKVKKLGLVISTIH